MSVSGTGRRILRWLVVVLWMGVIYYLSAQPDLPHHPEAVLDLLIKKLGHMAEYAVLAVLAWWAWRDDHDLTSSRAFLFALGLAALYAVSDEVHQYFVPGRDPQLLDVGIDVLGSALSLYATRRTLSVTGGRRVR
jgi:VanZ family protein